MGEASSLCGLVESVADANKYVAFSPSAVRRHMFTSHNMMWALRVRQSEVDVVVSTRVEQHTQMAECSPLRSSSLFAPYKLRRVS